MKTSLPYCSNDKAIKGYAESTLAKKEKNDCVVRSLASAFNIPYEDSHEYVRKMFHRQNRQGTRNFVYVMNALFDNGEKIGKKRFKPLGVRERLMNKYSLVYDVKVNGEKVKRKMTVGTFISKHKKGSYVLTVNGHAFTVKDGVVIGNTDDAMKKKKILTDAWKVLSR